MKNILKTNVEPATLSELHGRTSFVCDWVKSKGIDNKSILNIGSGFGWFERFLIETNETLNVCGMELLNEDVDRLAKWFSDKERVKISQGSALGGRNIYPVILAKSQKSDSLLLWLMPKQGR